MVKYGEGIRKHNLYRSVVYIKYIVNIAILLRSNKKKTRKYCSTYNIQLRLSAILIHECIEFLNRHRAFQSYFCHAKPAAFVEPTAEFTMVLDKPFLRTYATVLVVPCISHACTSTRPNDFQMRFPLCIVPLFFSLFPATNTYSYSQ